MTVDAHTLRKLTDGAIGIVFGCPSHIWAGRSIEKESNT